MRGVSAFASALVLTYELAYHAVVVGLNPLQLVLVGVVLESMTVLFEIPTGVVADLYSRRLSVILGIFLTGLGFLIETLIPTFALILLAQVIWGIGFCFYSGAEAAWITDEIGIERAPGAFLRATQLSQAFSIVGIFLGAVFSQINILLPVILGAALFIGLAGVLCFTMPETGFQPLRHDQRQNFWHYLSLPMRECTRLIRVHPLLWLILLLGLIIGLYVGGFDRLYTPYLLTEITPPAIGRLEPVVWLGLLNGLVNIGSLIGTEIVRRRYQVDNQLVVIRLLVMFHSGIVLVSIAFALTGVFIIAAMGFCLIQILRNVSRPLLLAWINQNAEKHIRATVISAYWQANALGQIVGSPILGWIGTTTSLRMALGVGTGVYTATLPVLLLAQRRWSHIWLVSPETPKSKG
jgi:DHA3 family tetracycline resistance protein-like MFS transporter